LRALLNYNPLIAALQWKINAKKLSRILNVVDPEKLFFMKFEEVLSNPERTINKLCDFLEGGYSNEFLQVPHIGSSYSNDNPDKRGIRGLQAFSKDHCQE
jgi:hypothetical protein